MVRGGVGGPWEEGRMAEQETPRLTPLQRGSWWQKERVWP